MCRRFGSPVEFPTIDYAHFGEACRWFFSSEVDRYDSNFERARLQVPLGEEQATASTMEAHARCIGEFVGVGSACHRFWFERRRDSFLGRAA